MSSGRSLKKNDPGASCAFPASSLPNGWGPIRVLLADWESGQAPFRYQLVKSSISFGLMKFSGWTLTLT